MRSQLLAARRSRRVHPPPESKSSAEPGLGTCLSMTRRPCKSAKRELSGCEKTFADTLGLPSDVFEHTNKGHVTKSSINQTCSTSHPSELLWKDLEPNKQRLLGETRNGRPLLKLPARATASIVANCLFSSASVITLSSADKKSSPHLQCRL